MWSGCIGRFVLGSLSPPAAGQARMGGRQDGGQAGRVGEQNQSGRCICEHNCFPLVLWGSCLAGYVVVNALMRMQAAEGMNVDRAIRRFAQARPPGIYKDQYIEDLFR
jgi:hypothetical protein